MGENEPRFDFNKVDKIVHDLTEGNPVQKTIARIKIRLASKKADQFLRKARQEDPMFQELRRAQTPNERLSIEARIRQRGIDVMADAIGSLPPDQQERIAALLNSEATRHQTQFEDTGNEMGRAISQMFNRAAQAIRSKTPGTKK